MTTDTIAVQVSNIYKAFGKKPREVQGIREEAAGSRQTAPCREDARRIECARDRRRHRRLLRRKKRRDLRRHGPLRLRQVDTDPDAQRAARADGRDRHRPGFPRSVASPPPSSATSGGRRSRWCSSISRARPRRSWSVGPNAQSACPSRVRGYSVPRRALTKRARRPRSPRSRCRILAAATPSFPSTVLLSRSRT